MSDILLCEHRHAKKLPWDSKLLCVSMVTTRVPVCNLQQIQANSN